MHSTETIKYCTEGLTVSSFQENKESERVRDSSAALCEITLSGCSGSLAMHVLRPLSARQAFFFLVPFLHHASVFLLHSLPPENEMKVH